MDGFFKKIIFFFLVIGIFFAPITIDITTSNTEIFSVIEKIQIGTSTAHAQNAISNLAGEALSGISSSITGAILMMFRNMSYGIFVVSAFIMFISGVVLDIAVTLTVSRMSVFVNSMGDLIPTLWTVFRDLANVAFVFVLLYAGIQTMIGNAGSSVKKIVTNVIIAAVFVNFSLFLTQFAIDVSNTLSFAIYQQTIEVIGAPTAEVDTTQALGITNPLSNDVSGDDLANLISSTRQSGLAAAYVQSMNVASVIQNLPEDATLGQEVGANVRFIFMQYFNSILLILASIILIVPGAIFVYRFIVLIFLMIFSPIALVGIILPKLKSSLTDKWSTKLMDHLIYPPVFFLFVFVSIQGLAGVNRALIDNSLVSGGLVIQMVFSMMFSIIFLGIPVLAAKTTKDNIGGILTKAYDGAKKKAVSLTAGKATRFAVGGAANKFEEYAKNNKFLNLAPLRDLRKDTTQALQDKQFFGAKSFKQAEKDSKKTKQIFEGIDLRTSLADWNEEEWRNLDQSKKDKFNKKANDYIRGLKGDELKDALGDIIKHPQLARFLSKSQIEQLEKNDEVSTADIDKLKDNRRVYFGSHENVGDLKNLSKDEVANLGDIYHKYKTSDEGNVVRDEDGNPIYETDDNGNKVVNKDLIKNYGIKNIINVTEKADPETKKAAREAMQNYAKQNPNEAKNLSDEDLAKIGNIYKEEDGTINSAVISGIGIGKLTSAMKKMDPDQKQKAEDSLNEFVQNATGQAVTNIVSEINSMNDEQLSQMPSVLFNKKEVVDNMDLQSVQQVFKSGSREARKNLGITVTLDPKHEAYDYVTKGPAGATNQSNP